MAERQSIISILERNIRDFSFSNITFQAKIDCDPTILDQLKACKTKIKILRFAYIFMVTITSSLLFLLLLYIPKILRGYPILSFVLILTTEFFLFALIGSTAIYQPSKIPTRYYIFIHERPRFLKTLIVVTQFASKNKRLSIIPLDSIAKLVLNTTKRLRICTWEITTWEIEVLDTDNKLLIAFGAFGKKNEIKKVASELWRFLKLRNYVE